MDPRDVGQVARYGTTLFLQTPRLWRWKVNAWVAPLPDVPLLGVLMYQDEDEGFCVAVGIAVLRLDFGLTRWQTRRERDRHAEEYAAAEAPAVIEAAERFLRGS